MAESVGENIKKVRKSKGLTQKELAEMLGVSQQTVAQYERTDKMPKIKTIKTIAEVLNVPVDTIIFSYPDGQGYELMFENAQKEAKAANDKIIKNEFIKYYDKLNSSGKLKAIERVHELTLIKKYTDPDEQ